MELTFIIWFLRNSELRGHFLILRVSESANAGGAYSGMNNLIYYNSTVSIFNFLSFPKCREVLFIYEPHIRKLGEVETEQIMKKGIRIIIIVIILGILAIGAGAYFIIKMPRSTAPQAQITASTTAPDASPVRSGEGSQPASASNGASGATPAAIAEIPTYQYTETYTSPTYKFTFKYPKDFTIQEIPTDTGETIIVQNIPMKIGVQIVISKFDGPDIDLTQDYIQTQVPDMKITESQELLVGANRKGLAFLSDNENFGGKSREVWFVYGGNLYQISTYAELDPFLKGLFGTWQFTL